MKQKKKLDIWKGMNNMLKKVLSSETCASCRICCSFVKEDAWESPVFSEVEMEQIRRLGISEKKFYEIEQNGRKGYQADYQFENEHQILLCPCLDEKKGCLLGEHKPFECSIWPIRIFEDENGGYLGLAEVCPAFSREKKRILMQELEEGGLKDRILKEKNRQTVIKESETGYERL